MPKFQQRINRTLALQKIFLRLPNAWQIHQTLPGLPHVTASANFPCYCQITICDVLVTVRAWLADGRKDVTKDTIG